MIDSVSPSAPIASCGSGGGWDVLTEAAGVSPSPLRGRDRQ
jgi:hypothetical protein